METVRYASPVTLSISSSSTVAITVSLSSILVVEGRWESPVTASVELTSSLIEGYPHG